MVFCSIERKYLSAWAFTNLDAVVPRQTFRDCRSVWLKRNYICRIGLILIRWWQWEWEARDPMENEAPNTGSGWSFLRPVLLTTGTGPMSLKINELTLWQVRHHLGTTKCDSIIRRTALQRTKDWPKILPRVIFYHARVVVVKALTLPCLAPSLLLREIKIGYDHR